MSDPRGDHDKAALSVYLSDLHNLIRGPSPTLANAIRVLSEPLHFLGLVSPPPPQHNATATSTTARYPIWNGPVQPTRELRRYFVQQLLPSHLDFILDSITVDWLSALPSSAAQAALFDVYFVPRITAAVGSHSIHDKDLLPKDDGCSDQCMGITVVALQTLVGRLTRKAFEQNHSFLNQTILRLLRKHLEHYTLLDYHVYIATYWSTGPDRHGESGSKMHGKLKEAGQATTKELALEVEDTFWDSFLSKLFSVPTRVSNAMGSRFEAGRGPSLEQDVACFHEKVFLERLAGQLKTCFEVMAMTKTDREKVLRVKHMELCQEVDGHQHRALTFLQQEGRAVQAFGGVLDKFLKLGYSKIIVKELMLTMWSLPDSVTSAGCRRALTLQSASRSARLFLFALVDHLQQHHVEFKQGSQPQTQEQEKQQLLAIHQGAKLLVALGYGVGGENNEWMEQILFQGKVYSLCILRMLLCVQSAWPDPVQATKDSVLAQCFLKALLIWSDAMLVKHSAADYQKYISYQILLMLGYFDSRILSSMDLIPVFGAGMNNWLDLENTRRKTISLVVAEEFTKAMAAGETSADFELDPSDPEICLARSLVELKDGTRPYQPLEIPSKDGADNEEQLFEVSHAEIEDEDEDEDPDEIIGGFTRARIDSGDETEDTDSDEDSDEDLKPYSMEYESDPDEEIGAVKKPMVPQPLYLRDLNTYLKANEDRDKFEIGLGKAADLIRRKAASLELEEYADKLAFTLIQVQDNFDTKGFYRQREDALVALVVTMPIPVVGVLTVEFYEKRNSIGQRLNILTAIALGARELSGMDAPPTTPGARAGSTATASPAAMATTAHERKPAPTFDSVTSQIALTQTRRFSQKSVIEASRPAPKANPFANLAPAFIGGLLGRWGGNRGAGMERGYDVLQRAPVVLLQKFVMTLGVLLYYSGNSTHLMAMTRELFQFFLALRYSIPPSQTAPPMAGLGNSPVMISDSLTSMLSTVSGSSTPAITSLKLPGDGSSLSPGVGGGGYGSNSRSVATGSQYDQRFNKDLVESILFGLLIMVTPSTSALPDELMVGEFYPEIMECQQWSMELWEEGQLSQGGAAEGGGKATMYCAALLQRCFELLKIDL